MSDCLDSSILVAAVVPEELAHTASLQLLRRGDCAIYRHALLESFSTLTGSRLGQRVDPWDAARLLRRNIRPRVTVLDLDLDETLDAIDGARSRGVRGGAIYDYMHLVAARKARAEFFYTLNTGHFLAFWREGDPEIRRP